MEKQKEKPVKIHMSPALILIDVQNQYMQYMAEKSSKSTCDTINGALGSFRHFKFPIICVYHTDPQWGPLPDTDAFQFDPIFNVKPDDHKIIKNFPNAFKKTNLDKYLKEKGCNTLFLCGLSAVGCVLATYQSAIDLDYYPFMIKNGIMSHDSSFTKFIENSMESVTYNTMNYMLASV
jgi:nicotinamidase-related amidase